MDREARELGVRVPGAEDLTEALDHSKAGLLDEPGDLVARYDLDPERRAEDVLVVEELGARILGHEGQELVAQREESRGNLEWNLGGARGSGRMCQPRAGVGKS